MESLPPHEPYSPTYAKPIEIVRPASAPYFTGSQRQNSLALPGGSPPRTVLVSCGLLGAGHTERRLSAQLPPDEVKRRLITDIAKGNGEVAFDIPSPAFTPKARILPLKQRSSEPGSYSFISRQNCIPVELIRQLQKISNIFFSAFELSTHTPLPEMRHDCLKKIQWLAELTINNLLKKNKLNMAQAALAIIVIHEIKEDELFLETTSVGAPKSFSSLATRVSFLFYNKIFQELPVCFPKTFQQSQNKGLDFTTEDCKRMGLADGVKPELTPTMLIAISPDVTEREKLQDTSTNALRFVMAEMKVRSSLPWLFKGVCPRPFYSDALDELGKHGFELVTERPPKAGDLVVYLKGKERNTRVVHYGVLLDRVHVLSKWDRNIPLKHPIDGLPDELKGRTVQFYSFSPRIIEQEILHKMSQRTFNPASISIEIELLLRNEIETCEMREITNEGLLYNQSYYSKLKSRLINSLKVIQSLPRDQRESKIKELVSSVKSGSYFNVDFLGD